MGITSTAKERTEKETKVRRKPGRVPTSCAECRRLKLRCDRNVPCEKCVSRGCGSICPDGSLASGKGNRLVLANTEELHERIEGLCSRIRELETALRTLQQDHPLLRSELLQIKAPQGANPPPKKETKDERIDTLGTLVLGPQGQFSFLGPSARSHHLLFEKKPPNHRLPQPISGQDVFSRLPNLSEAIQLCEIYQDYGKYMYTPIARTDLFDDTLALVFRSETFDALTCRHSLALLFVIFALASLFNANIAQANSYLELCRATLALCPDHTTLKGIQTVAHIAQFLEFKGDTQGAWRTISDAVRQGQSIGLHINPSKWSLPAPLSESRNRLFWSVFVTDTWSSFFLGRPPTLTAAFTDPSIPCLVDTDPQGEVGFHTWSIQFTSLLHSLLSSTLLSTPSSIKPPHPYATIIGLDRKIRDFPLPNNLRWPCPDVIEGVPMHLRIQRWFVLLMKEIVLLALHRPYVLAISSSGDSNSEAYLPSLISTYRSSWRLSRGLSYLHSQFPDVVEKVTAAWYAAFSAAAVLALIGVRKPGSQIANAAMEELGKIESLLEKVATTRSEDGTEEAGIALEQGESPFHVLLENVRILRQKATSSESGTEELERLVGKTYFWSEHPNILSTHLSSSSPSVSSASPSLSNTASSGTTPPSMSTTTTTTTTAPLDSTSHDWPLVHPTLASDIQNLDHFNADDMRPMMDLPSPFAASSFSLPITLPTIPQITPEGGVILDENQMEDVQWGVPYPLPFSAIQPPTPTTGWGHGFGGGGGGGGGGGLGLGNNGSFGGFGFGQAMSTSTNAQTPIPPLMLDSTWQSFVEQLGF